MYGKMKKRGVIEFNLHPETILKSEVRQSSVVDVFCVSETVDPEEGTPLIKYHDPIYMMFNQQRLESLGSGAIQMFLDSLSSSGDSSLAELRSHCSDSDLIHLIKSRYIQSPSEIKSWLTYCSNNIDSFKAELASIQNAHSSDEPLKTD